MLEIKYINKLRLDKYLYFELIKLLFKLDSKKHISVKFSFEEMDITFAEGKADYE